MPPPLAQVRETTFRVRYAETDMMGIVHHSNYLIYLEAGRIDFTHQINMPYVDLETNGYSLAVTEIEIRYHAPARFDQSITVKTWVEGLRSRLITFGYEVVDTETQQILVTARTRLICVDHQNQVKRIPESWFRALQAVSLKQ